MESEIIRSLSAQGIVGIILALLVVALWRIAVFIAKEIALPLTKSAIDINTKTVQHMKIQEDINSSIKEAVVRLSENLIEMHNEQKKYDEEIIVTLDKLEDKIEKQKGGPHAR